MSVLNYGWDSKDDNEDSFWIRFGPCTREPKEWKEEIYAAVRSIVNRTTRPIWICSSGGIKSEIVCRAFYDQGIHFSVLTLEHEAGTNRHDIQYAVKWCREHTVPQKIVKIDMTTFLNSEVDAYAERYIAAHPFRYFQIKLMELVEGMGGYAVLGVDESIYYTDLKKPHTTRSDLYLPFTTGNVAPLKWCEDSNASHEPYFFFGTPELCLSYMRLPLVSFALDNPETVFRHRGNAYTLRRLVFQSVWTDLETRYKSTGFEGIDPLFQDAMRRLQKKLGQKQVEYRLPVKMLEQQLTERLYETSSELPKNA